MGKKTPVVEYLFNQRWNASTRTLANPVVTIGDVANALRVTNQANPSLNNSENNPANFFKDFVRVIRSANKNWPASVLGAGYTARQITGAGECFEFVALPPGQTVAFLGVPAPPLATPFRVETVSLPMASRRLGRADERWLTQVLVRVRLIETHLSLNAGRPDVLQIDHLQMSAKFSRAEVDSLYLGIESLPGGGQREFIVSCEAKGVRDDILEDQVLAQVRELFKQSAITQDVVVPIAVKVLAPPTPGSRVSLLQLVQFDDVARSAISTITALTVRCNLVYELVPPVPGIGF